MAKKPRKRTPARIQRRVSVSFAFNALMRYAAICMLDSKCAAASAAFLTSSSEAQSAKYQPL